MPRTKVLLRFIGRESFRQKQRHNKDVIIIRTSKYKKMEKQKGCDK